MPRSYTFPICLILLMIAGCSDRSAQTSTGTQGTEPVGQAKSDSSNGGEKSASVPAEDPDWAKTRPAAPAEKTSANEDLLPVNVTLDTVDETGYTARLAGLKGKVVLVDFWATWCIPCRKSFPHTVELAHQHSGEGLAVISVALDEEIAVGEVQKFLEQNRADLINLRSTYGADDPSFEKFGLGTTGLPHYKLYARDGSVVKTFVVPEDGNAIDTKEIDRAVEAELAR